MTCPICDQKPMNCDCTPRERAMWRELQEREMTDITTRLRKWAIATHAVPASDLMDEAADEIERLRAAMPTADERRLCREVLRGEIPDLSGLKGLQRVIAKIGGIE